MPVQPAYPGVYVEDFSSSIAIQPVPTSVAAFLGRTPLGPLHQTQTVFSLNDFTRSYGALSKDFPLTAAVAAFFDNGGQQAIIGRLFEPSAPTPAEQPNAPSRGTASLVFSADKAALILHAASPGTWGNHLSAAIDTNEITPLVAQQLQPSNLASGDLFNLTLTCRPPDAPAVSERFLNLTLNSASSNRIDRILQSQSQLCRCATPLPPSPPANGAIAYGTGGHDGKPLSIATYLGNADARSGLHMLDQLAAFNLLCIPPDTHIAATDATDLPPAVLQAAASYCCARRAIFLADPPSRWITLAAANDFAAITPNDLGIDDLPSLRATAVYFPNLRAADNPQPDHPAILAPCGAMAGIIAANDLARGVWTSPAGITAEIKASALTIDIDDEQNALLNARGINCLRTLPTLGTEVWGARTLAGADQLQDDYRYLAVRRLVFFLESSIYNSTKFAVFESNDESLWSQLRLMTTSFLADLQRQGAFYNFNVICDATTTSPDDINRGICNLVVSIAPTAPGQFLELMFQLTATIPN